MLERRQLISGVMAAWLLASAAGCSGESRKAGHLNRANRYYEKQQFEQARLEYINVLKLDAKEPLALYRLASILYDSGQVPQAFALLRQVEEVDPGNLDARARLARIYIGAGQIEPARKQALAVLDKEPGHEAALLILTEAANSPELISQAEQRIRRVAQGGSNSVVHLAMANLALRRDDLTTADAEIALAQSLNPKSSLGHLALANLRWRQGQLPAAESAFKTAVNLSRSDWVVRLKWADFQLNNGRFAEARSTASEITKKHANHVPALFCLARIAYAEKKWDESDSLLKRVLTINPADAEASLLSAQVNFAKGDAAAAIAGLERLRDQYPDMPQFHYQLALGYLNTQSTANATASLEKALSVDPKFDPAALLLAELEMRRGNFEPAIRSLTALIQRSPKTAQAHALLAEAHRARGQFDQALAACQKWKDLAPTMPQPFYMAGLILRQQNKNAEARAEFNKSLELAPAFMAAVEQLTEMDLRDNKAADALARAEKLVAAHPQSPVPLMLLARIHMLQRNTAQAEATILKALELQPDLGAASMLLAQLYISSNRQDEALARLQGVLEKNPRNTTALLQIAMIQQEAKKIEEARQSYERLLAINPKVVVALNNLAYLYADNLNDLETAYKHAKAARDLAPEDPSVADTFGWVLCRRGEHAWALSLLSEAASKRPSTPEIQFHLGTTYYLMGEEAEARLAFQNALGSPENFPSKTQAEERMAILNIKPESASPEDTARLRQAVTSNPRDTMALIRFAQIAEHNGEIKQATDFYTQAVQCSPKSTSLIMRLARFYADRAHDPAKAYEQAKSARDLDPQDADIAHALARYALEVRDFGRAHGLLQELAQKRPNQPTVLFDLARAQYGRGRIPDSERTMKRALELGNAFPEAESAKHFLELVEMQRDPAQAAEQQAKLREILSREPENIQALMADAAQKDRGGNAEEAQRIYQDRVLKLVPDFAPAWRELAFIYSRQPNGESRAFEAGLKAREVFAQDPALARLLGEIAFQRKDFDRAAQFLDQSARHSKPEADLLYRLGIAHQQTKRKDQAKNALQRALTLSPNPQLKADIDRALTQLK